MSKKCCGIIYNENEKFCTMCGKSLAELPDVLVTEDATAVADNNKEEVKPGEVKPEEIKEDSTETDVKGEDVKLEEAQAEVDNIQLGKSTMPDIDMAEVDRIAASVAATDDTKEPEPESDTLSKNALETENADIASEHKEEPEEEDDDEDDEDDGTASAGLKFFGTLIILLMIASIGAVGLGVYLMMLNPFYRNHDINNPVVYEEMATDTDVTNIETRPVLAEVSLPSATETDAALDEEATETDATETDADVSEDME